MSKVQEFKSCRSCGFSHMNSSAVHRDNCPKCGARWYWGWVCPKCNTANHYREYYDDAECDYCNHVPSKQSSNSSGGCFISTATLLALGKEDNCRELNSLRKFRDTYIKQHYPDLIIEYYKIAPHLCRNIEMNKDSDSIYNSIWKKTLSKCLQLIEKNHPERALKLYVDLVCELKEKYSS